MKTVFDKKVTNQLIVRINALDPEVDPIWGKMTVFQMLKHCTMSEEMFQRKTSYKRLLIGRLFGGIALKQILKDETAMKRNQPTHPLMKITGQGDWQNEKTKWIELLRDYEKFPAEEFIHPFFGKMSHEQIGNYVFKHTDHHLRQFGV